MPDEEIRCVSFSASSHPVANPERGFYRYSATYSDRYSPLIANELARFREVEGVTLLFRHFYLNDFQGGPISDDYLESVRADFSVIRRAGIKCIIRFAYADQVKGDFEPPYRDASKERILRHIYQLAPLLEEHSDVVAVVQAGFIGLWGEGYYTDHFANAHNPSDISQKQYRDREEVLRALLEAVGHERMVQIRCVPMKERLLGRKEVQGPLTASEAYKPTARARIGFYNDCFLASTTDYGTYSWNRIAEDQAYLEKESQFVPVGGETCHPNPPRSSCTTALKELERFHWSYLNMQYHPDVLAAWERSGCLGEIKKRLGYRFVLQEAQAPYVTSLGEQLSLTLKLRNTGWATPFNAREVRLVLLATDGSAEYNTVLSEDPRFWGPDEDITIQATVDLPSDFPKGIYKILLHLPDPAPALIHRPEYAIRFANEGIWKPATGHNELTSVVLT